MKVLCLVQAEFESFVNSEECKTMPWNSFFPETFESFVNSEECKTGRCFRLGADTFESFVNSEECKTHTGIVLMFTSLRALLIQKSVKPV